MPEGRRRGLQRPVSPIEQAGDQAWFLCLLRCVAPLLLAHIGPLLALFGLQPFLKAHSGLRRASRFIRALAVGQCPGGLHNKVSLLARGLWREKADCASAQKTPDLGSIQVHRDWDLSTLPAPKTGSPHHALGSMSHDAKQRQRSRWSGYEVSHFLFHG
jgi:hypothetical protein